MGSLRKKTLILGASTAACALACALMEQSAFGVDQPGGPVTPPQSQAVPPSSSQLPSRAQPPSQSQAPAQISSAQSQILTPWADTSKYQECDQVCLLQRANETISLQAVYLSNRITYLEGLDSDAEGGDLTASSKILAEVGSYCPDQATNSHQCLKRYITVQIPVLRSMKTAMQNNQYAQLGYRSDIATIRPDGTFEYKKIVPVTSVASGMQPVPKIPQTPYAMTSTQIKQEETLEQANSEKIRMLASEKYRDWVGKLPSAPLPSDFYKWNNDVLINRAHPELGKMSVLQTGSDGKPLIDQAAYQKAQAEYASTIKEFQDVLKTPGTASAPSPSDPKAGDSGDLDVYRESHNEFVDQSNKMLVKDASGGVPGSLASLGKRNGGVTPAGDSLSVPVAPTLTGGQKTIGYPPAQMESDIEGFEKDVLNWSP